MSDLSNSLADLAERAKEAHSAYTLADQTSAEKAIEAGHLLLEAKAECRHGEWLPFLNRAGLAERKAQRFMALARSGLKPSAVSDLGGITAALRWLQDLVMPIPGKVLLASLDGFLPDTDGPLAFVWQQKEGFHVAVMDFGSPGFIVCTKKPLVTFQGATQTLFHALDYRYADMEFGLVDDHVADLDCVKKMRHDVVGAPS